MAFYQVRFSVGAGGEYLYPPAIKGVVWKLAVYHHAQPSMIGETEEELRVEDKDLLPLQPEAARKLIEEHRASYPANKDSRPV